VKIAGNYDVLTYNSKPMSAAVYQDVKGEGKDSEPVLLWQSVPEESEGSFFIAPTDKRLSSFRLCLQNGVLDYGRWPDENGASPAAADKRNRKVGMSLRGMTAEDVLDGSKHEHASTISRSKEAARELYEVYETLSDHQRYMRQREIDHREVVEVTNSRVANWRIMEAVVLVGVCAWQCYFLKSSFEQKRDL
jgi:hypothetical protein